MRKKYAQELSLHYATGGNGVVKEGRGKRQMVEDWTVRLSVPKKMWRVQKLSHIKNRSRKSVCQD